MVGRMVGALLGLWVVSCGGKGEHPISSGGAGSAAGGMSGSGGAAGGLSAGGSSATSAAGGNGVAGASGVPRGAFSMHIVPGDGCSLGDQWLDFPVVDGGHPVTATQTVKTINDGATDQVLNSSGMSIDTTVSRLTCRWGGRNPDFDFQVGFRFGPAGREGTLSMGAGIRVGQSQTLGFVLQGQDWQSSYSGQCTFTAHEVNDATRSVRGEVSCPALDALTDMPATPNHEVCTLPNGSYTFENCTPP